MNNRGGQTFIPTYRPIFVGARYIVALRHVIASQHRPTDKRPIEGLDLSDLTGRSSAKGTLVYTRCVVCVEGS